MSLSVANRRINSGKGQLFSTQEEREIDELFGRFLVGGEQGSRLENCKPDSVGFIRVKHNSFFKGDACSPVWHEGENLISVDPKHPYELPEYRKTRLRAARYLQVRDGSIRPWQVASFFARAVDWYSNSSLIFEKIEGEDEGKMCAIPTNSRWNYRYKGWYKRKYWLVRHALRNRRNLILLTLTYKPAYLLASMERDGYEGDIYGFALYRVWSDVNSFLKQLYRYRKNRGLPWTYVCSVLEPHKSGLPHVHLVFDCPDSGWLAPIELLVNFWGWCEPQGVDIRTTRKLRALYGNKPFSPALYLAGYLKKSRTKAFIDDKVNLFYAYLYFFSVRSFNLAHKPCGALKVQPEWLAIGYVRLDGDPWDGVTGILFSRYRNSRFGHGLSPPEDDLWTDFCLPKRLIVAGEEYCIS
jgi:hypothetical protein